MSDDDQTVANFEKIFDKLESLEGMVKSDKLDFIEYTSHNPVISELWAEGRLRAIESLEIEKTFKSLKASIELLHLHVDKIEELLDKVCSDG